MTPVRWVRTKPTTIFKDMISPSEPMAGPAPARFPFTHLDLTSRVAVVDYETFYDDEYSVAKMSYWHYTHHPRFRAYRVAIVTSDGLRWVGDPKDAPWESIRHHFWVAHNRPFDWSVHERLKELGIVPTWSPPYWGNSANLCAWIRVPRGLAKAVLVLYGIKHSKDIRDRDMKGKSWEEYGEALQKRVDAYALRDCELTLRIWLDHVQLWPLPEIRISDLIDNRGLRGLCVDREGMDRDMDLLRKVIFESLLKIPWRDTDEKILSHPACARECRKLGIPVPSSLAMNDEDLEAWEEKYGEKHQFVAAMRDYRRMNAILKKYEMIKSRIKDDGRFEFSVAYLGTHTGRTSGKDKAEQRRGANMLNLPRDPFYIREDFTVVHRKKELKAIAAFRQEAEKRGDKQALPPGIAHMVDLRSKIVAPPGYKFVICDKSQIEARITNWLARDHVTLRLIREGISVYEAHARALMGYVPKPDGKGLKKDQPRTYALAKARELALGFQAGHVKFIEMAPLYIDDEDIAEIFGAPVDEATINDYRTYLFKTSQAERLKEFDGGDDELRRYRVNSWLQVEQYRDAKKDTLVPLWRRLDVELKRSASAGGMHEVALPSGRVLRYFDTKIDKEGTVTATVERGGAVKYFYGGKILENAVQATARDLFVEDQLKLDDLGIDVVLDVYDEVVSEVPLNFNADIITEVMSTTPAWASGLPVGAETECSTYYKK